MKPKIASKDPFIRFIKKKRKKQLDKLNPMKKRLKKRNKK